MFSLDGIRVLMEKKLSLSGEPGMPTLAIRREREKKSQLLHLVLHPIGATDNNNPQGDNHS